jgi:propionate CoA-transferase
VDSQVEQGLLHHFQQWFAHCSERDTHYADSVADNPKFMSAREAAALVNDDYVVAFTGIAANQRACILHWALRERYEQTGHPRGITALIASGAGGRGKLPGSLEEIGLEGLCGRFISGHLETYKSFLKLAAAGSLELQCIPQGIFVRLIHAMAEGKDHFTTHAGVGTFIDPRVGRGTPVIAGCGEQLVTVDEGKLRFTCPPIDVAMFNLPAADRHGNLYAKQAAVVCEARDIARAARRNGGRAIANVGMLVEEGHDAIFIPAAEVDAIVLHPDTEQVCSVPYRKHWPMFTTQSDISLDEGIGRVRFINNLIGVTPKRTAVDDALARLVALMFMQHARPGSRVDIGVGLPEDASRLLYESGATEQLQLMTESGLFGGIPCPGIFFGAAINPEECVTSYEAFERMYDRLEVAILGLLEADSDGNVNVSKRGDGPINYVGPGGFIDITTCADLILFCGSWMAHAEMTIEDGSLRITKPGAPKFIHRVDEITFSGKEALARGQKVFYITNVGAFQLTTRGMELIITVPGVDIECDILDASPMRIVLPKTGIVPVADRSIMTGEGFTLRWN